MLRCHALSLFVALAACTGDPVPVSTPDAATDVASDSFDAMLDAPADVAANDARDVVAESSERMCSFNRDCPDAERCACSTSAGCRCLVGPRGTGVSGVDRCTSGDDCASALCVEANGGVSLCSDACTRTGDCPAALPRCVSVSLVGRFCARDPAAMGDGGVADAPADCMGPCATTTLQATFGARSGAFDRAQYGNDGATALRIEAHFGGDPACPTAASPTPRRTLVLTGVRATADATPQTMATGVRATLFDFGGDLVSAPLLSATAVQVTPRAWRRDGYVSLDVSATFSGGTIRGGLFAPHCTSLDGM